MVSLMTSALVIYRFILPTIRGLLLTIVVCLNNVIVYCLHNSARYDRVIMLELHQCVSVVG